MGLLGTLGSLNVLLSADTAQFTSAMDKAAYAAEKNLYKIGIATKLSLTALFAAFIANTKAALTFADSIGDMADRLGITSKQMSILAYAAKMSDVDVSNLETTMRRMYVNAYQNSKVFTDLGIKVKDSSGKFRSGYDIFLDTAEVFSKMPDGIGKTTAAVEIFGKSGADITLLLNTGKTGIAEFAQEAKKFNVIVGEETAKNADRFDKAVKKATEATKGFGIATIDSYSSSLDFYLSFFTGVRGSSLFVKALDFTNKNVEESTKVNKDNSQSAIEQAAAFEQVIEAAEKKKKLDEEGTKLTDNLRTAQEIYNDEIQKYKDLLDAGSISQETYGRALKKAGDTLTESTQKTNKMKDAAQSLGFTFQSAFEDAIIEGENLSDVLDALLKDIERIILRTAVTGPLADALSAGISSFFGTSAKTTTSAHGNIFSHNRLIPFATGGLITRPTLFPMANGGMGLAGEEHTEAIMPLFRTSNGDLGVKSGGRGNVEVNVYAPEGSKVTQDNQTIGDKEQINIMIDEAVSGAVKSPGSKTYKALKNSFGLKQSTTSR